MNLIDTRSIIYLQTKFMMMIDDDDGDDDDDVDDDVAPAGRQ